MGRYYSGANFDGKFWFGVQPSDDPGTVFKMDETPPSQIEYYLDGSGENIAMVEEILDEQFDILKVPKEERLYEMTSDEVDKYVEKISKRYLFRDRNPGDPSDKNRTTYWCEADDKKKYPHGMVADTRAKELATARIDLGLKILTDLRQGECYLNAEL